MLDTDISDTAIKREYKKLGEINGLDAYIDSHVTHVIVVDPIADALSGRLARVLRLEFKHRPLLNFTHNFKNVVQENKVSVQRADGNKGIASAVYKMLVDNSFTLVSDVTQFDTTKGLWKKLARATDYRMYVADIDHGIFKDSNGEDIVYNGTNISDSEIWTGGSDFNGSYRVLILTN